MTPETVLKAQRGDAAAMEEVAEEMKPEVKRIARRYYLIGADTEDLIQEGMLGLFKAIAEYDETKGGFFGFASVCIHRRILQAIEKANSGKNLPLNNSLPLDDLERFAAEESQDPLKRVIDKEETDYLEKIIETKLSNLEKRVVFLFLKGYNYGEIARSLEITEKSVDNTLQRVKNKLGKFKDYGEK